MIKLQRIRKINRENKSLTTTIVSKYINKHYPENPPKAEQLSPLVFLDSSDLYKIIKLMQKTSKLLLTKDYIWDYICNRSSGYESMSEEWISGYNERKYQDKIIEQILECGDDEDEKEMRLINKLNVESINILKQKMKYEKKSYSNSFRRNK